MNVRGLGAAFRLVLLASVVWVAGHPPLGASTSSLEAKLVADDGNEGDYFGEHLAVDDDTLVVAAPRASNGEASDAGAAYVFTRDSATGSWIELQKLVPSTSEEYLQFGFDAVAVQNDTIVVASVREEVDGNFQQGAVYVFTQSGEAAEPWVETQRLTDEGGQSFDYFGSSVALDGNLLAVGARGAGEGKVVLFERDRAGEGLWGEVTTILDSQVGDGGGNENFGSAVAIDDDLLLIGASDADVSNVYENDGAAYLFERNTDDPDLWELAARLTAHEAAVCLDGLTIIEFNTERPDESQTASDCARSEESRSDHDDFGFAVALEGDTAVIGARFAEGEDGGYSAGAAYVFERSADSDEWLEVAKLIPGDEGFDFAYFGTATALLDGTILVGAKGAPIGPKRGQGAAWIFERQSDGSWAESRMLIAADGFSNDGYGQAVALSSDDIVVAAAHSNGYRGAVYTYPTTLLDPSDPTGPGTDDTDDSDDEEPLFPFTGELSDGGVVSHDSGALLGASDGSGVEALPVWLHALDAPEAPRFVGSTVVGLTYNVGASEATPAAEGAAFSMTLPIPSEADTALLVAAAQVLGEPVFDDWTEGDLWVPLQGLLDVDNGVLVVTLPALSDTGMTVTLLEDPSLAEFTDALAGDGDDDTGDTGDSAGEPEDSADEPDDSSSADPATPEEPFFNVQCVGFSNDPSKCDTAEEQEIESELLAALAAYRDAGFEDPRLRRLVLGAYDADPSYGPRPVWILDNSSGFCLASFGLNGGTGGVYAPAVQDLYLCMDTAAGVTNWLKTAARHELFHAVQNAHSWRWYSPKTNKWVIEGMATAVMGNQGPPKLERYTGSSFDERRVDISLLDGGGETMTGVQPAHPHPERIPYEAQDFWVYFAQENGLELGDLVPILNEGASPEGVARAMTLPTLADTYWGWVKNQVIEKQVDLAPSSWSSKCYTERYTPGQVHQRDYPSESPQFEGELGPLTSAVVSFSFAESAFGIIVNAERAGEAEDFAYKVYRRGESDCEQLPDGERTFDSLGKYELLIVVVSNTSHEGTPISYKITLSHGDF